MDGLSEILKDHDDFYSHRNSNTGKGILNDKTVIEIEFVRNQTLYKIQASNIKKSSEQDIEVFIFTNEPSKWIKIEDDGFIDFFEFEHYSQKQIFEIAQEPNALRERIDKVITGMKGLKIERENINKEFLEISASIRTINNIVSEKGKVKTQIKDLDSNIKKLQTSGIADILIEKENLTKENQVISEFIDMIQERETELALVLENFNIDSIDYSNFNPESKSILEPFSELSIKEFKEVREKLQVAFEDILKIKNNYVEMINSSQWKTTYSENNKILEQKRLLLKEEGIDDILSFEKFMEEKLLLENKLEEITNKSKVGEELLTKRKELQSRFLEISKKITSLRRDFIKDNLKDDKIKINIKRFRNKNDFEIKLRKILQRENNVFISDVDKLINMIFFNGNFEENIQSFRKLFLEIRNGKDINDTLSSRFIELIKGMDEAQIDAIELLLPEDEIEIEYRPNSTAPFKMLSTASPGQKTTAILTLILSYGEVPLILDQPEDDLDNRLVYDLIVDRLSQAKEERQIIVVTHNANIPVNADAEYIISMSSDQDILKVLTTGTVDQDDMKKEICDVMEGGKGAFDMRYERYK